MDDKLRYLNTTVLGLTEQIVKSSYSNGEAKGVASDVHTLNSYIMSAVLVLLRDALVESTVSGSDKELNIISSVRTKVSNMCETTFYLEATEKMKEWQLKKMYDEVYDDLIFMIESLKTLLS